MASGFGHAASVVTCKYSPCGKYLVSGSSDGAVIIWKIPEVCLNRLPMKFVVTHELNLNNGFQKFWPTPGADALAITPSTTSKKISKYDKRPEDIKESDTSRSKKNLCISECPPIEKPSSTSTSANGKK